MGGVWSFTAALAGDWNGLGRVLVLSGLVVGVVNVVRFLRGTDAVRLSVRPAPRAERAGDAVKAYTRGASGAFLWPVTLVLLGFWVGGRLQNAVWIAVVVVAVAAVVGSGVRLLRAAQAARGHTDVEPTALAAVLATSLLLLFGLLLVVRLVVAPVPDGLLAMTISGDSVGDGLSTIVIPMAVVFAVLNADRLRRGARSARVVAATPERVRAYVVRHRHLIGMVAVTGLFFSALQDREKKLELFGIIAVAEYGKIL